MIADPEGRNPKARNPKTEQRGQRSPDLSAQRRGLGFRDFGFPSDFGLRISDFGRTQRPTSSA